MNHLRTVQAHNVVVSNVMMSNTPKMTCPGDPRAQTHTQIVRAYLSEVYKMSEVCKITRTIQNRFDMGGRYVPSPDKMRGWREGDDHHGRRRSDMLFFFRRENTQQTRN